MSFGSTLVPSERMTRRARAYLLVAAARHLIVGGYCVFKPESFAPAAYRGITDALMGLPTETAIIVWGWLFLVTGTMCLFAAIRGTEAPARVGLLMSVVTTACWGGGFLAAILTGVSTGPTGAVVWLAIALKDSTMLRQPLRNPFEGLTQRVMADQNGCHPRPTT